MDTSKLDPGVLKVISDDKLSLRQQCNRIEKILKQKKLLVTIHYSDEHTSPGKGEYVLDYNGWWLGGFKTIDKAIAYANKKGLRWESTCKSG